MTDLTIKHMLARNAFEAWLAHDDRKRNPRTKAYTRTLGERDGFLMATSLVMQPGDTGMRDWQGLLYGIEMAVHHNPRPVSASHTLFLEWQAKVLLVILERWGILEPIPAPPVEDAERAQRHAYADCCDEHADPPVEDDPSLEDLPHELRKDK